MNRRQEISLFASAIQPVLDIAPRKVSRPDPSFEGSDAAENLLREKWTRVAGPRSCACFADYPCHFWSSSAVVRIRMGYERICNLNSEGNAFTAAYFRDFALVSRSATPGQFFLEFCDGKFTDEDQLRNFIR